MFVTGIEHLFWKGDIRLCSGSCDIIMGLVFPSDNDFDFGYAFLSQFIYWKTVHILQKSVPNLNDVNWHECKV